jgi:hypothetical protein
MDGMGRSDNIVSFAQKRVAQCDKHNFFIVNDKDRTGLF